MKQSSKRLASMLLSALFVVGAGVIFFELIQPAYSDLQEKKGAQLSNEKFLEVERNTITQAKNLLSQYENVQEEEEDLALAMPAGPNIADGLAEIYGLAAVNGITLQNIGLSSPQITQQATGKTKNSSTSFASGNLIKPVGHFSFQLTALGSYESLKNFLSGLESNIRVFDVTDVSMQAAASKPEAKAGGGAQNLFRYSIKVNTYYQLP